MSQNADFAKPDFNLKPIMPTKPTKFYKLNLPETLLQKDKPILRAYQTNYEKNEATKQSQSKPKLTEAQVKKLEADFSDSTK